MTPDLSYSSGKEREKKMCEDNKWDEQEKKKMCPRCETLDVVNVFPIGLRATHSPTRCCSVVVVVVVVVLFFLLFN